MSEFDRRQLNSPSQSDVEHVRKLQLDPYN